MKIGIFGDSYVDGRTINEDLNQHTWATKLARMLGADHIGYHGRAGSPLYYSYQQLIQHGHLYDRIILAVTEPMRYPVAVGENQVFVSGYIGCNHFRNPLRDQLRGWFQASDPQYLNVIQELFLKDLSVRFPKILMVPCFKTSFTGSRAFPWAGWQLSLINQQMIQQLGLDQDQSRWNTKITEIVGVDHTLCHIPWEWHDAVAHAVHRYVMASRPSTIATMDLKLAEVRLERYYQRI